MELLEQITDLTSQVKQTLDRQAELKTSVRECKESLANRELLITVNGASRGRNAEERKTNLRMALQLDETYTTYTDDLRDLQAELDSADADVKAIAVMASILAASANLQAALISAGLATDERQPDDWSNGLI